MIRRSHALGWAAGALAMLLSACGGGSGATASDPAPSPLAAFTFTPASPVAGQAVSFTDASTPTPSAWSWSFGDGGTSASQSPSHTFLASGTYTVSLQVTTASGSSNATRTVTISPSASSSAWRFAMVGDTHVTQGATDLASELGGAMLADRAELVLVAGDLVEGGSGADATRLQQQLEAFRTAMTPLIQAGIPIYPVRGNHENDAVDNLSAWNAVFSGTAALPANGPSGETNLTYALTRHNALFIGLDEYVNLHRVNQAWLDAQLAANTRPHVFVFGHEAAFKGRHDDCLDDHPTERDAFWQSLTEAGARVYLCGHDHFADIARLDDGDGNAGNDLYQVIVGTGGGTLFTQSSYNGDNGAYSPVNVFHDDTSYGYLLVEVSGSGDLDLDVTLTWKRRTLDAATGSYAYVPAATLTYSAAPNPKGALPYAVVDTGLVDCFNATAVIPAPAPGQAFYGQDAQHAGLAPAYQDHGDGTVTDLRTGLMWVKARGAKGSWSDAVAGASACTVGGYTDWRMPTIKELYSLIQFTGAQGPSMTSTAGYLPFIDTTAFAFAYGAGTSTERVIDCQDWSGTAYVSTTMLGTATAFGVNFADGRIKGYPSGPTGASGSLTQNYVRYVRSNPAYGHNQFTDHGDGTITDTATGLMWSQADSGAGLDWEAALAWVQQKNAERYLGHDDWRMPNAKELHTLVDCTRAPDAPSPDRRGPAIDPLFSCTPITNEGGALDYPFYWTSTSFKDGSLNEVPAAYICFGRALGYMKLGGSTTYQLLDVHGAGAQRSDPKRGSPTDHLLGTDASGNPVYGRGPQGDVTRIANAVRLVRDAR